MKRYHELFDFCLYIYLQDGDGRLLYTFYSPLYILLVRQLARQFSARLCKAQCMRKAIQGAVHTQGCARLCKAQCMRKAIQGAVHAQGFARLCKAQYIFQLRKAQGCIIIFFLGKTPSRNLCKQASFVWVRKQVLLAANINPLNMVRTRLWDGWFLSFRTIWERNYLKNTFFVGWLPD